MYTTQITVDLSGRRDLTLVYAKQGDVAARQVGVSFLDHGQLYTIPSGAQARIRVTKPDRTYVFNDCTISGNVVTAPLTAQTLAAAGEAAVDIALTLDGDTLLSCSCFRLIISPRAGSDTAVESSNEFGAVDKLLQEAQESIPAATAAAERANEAAQAAEDIKAEVEEKLANGDFGVQDGVLLLGARRVRRGHKGSKASRESKDQKEIKEKKAILGRKALLEPPEPQAPKVPREIPVRPVQLVQRGRLGRLALQAPRDQKETRERPVPPDRREPRVQPDLPGLLVPKVQRVIRVLRVRRGSRVHRVRKEKKVNKERAASRSRYRGFFRWALSLVAVCMPTIPRGPIPRNLSTTAILESFII